MYIERLPFILGVLAALMTGMLSFDKGISQQTLYMRMAFSMLIFFFIGLYVKNTILEITKDIRLKDKKEEIRKSQNLSKDGTSSASDGKIKADEFQPLKVNDIIKTEKNSSTKENQ